MRKTAIVEQAARAGKGGEFGFEKPQVVWQARRMSNTATTNYASREAAARRLPELSDEEYEQVRQVLVRIELKHLMDDVCTAMDAARDAGKMNDVEESIRAYRQRHPYK